MKKIMIPIVILAILFFKNEKLLPNNSLSNGIQNCYNIVLRDYDGTILCSSNSGKTWSKEKVNNNFTIRMFDGSNYFVSFDKGKNWIDACRPSIYKIELNFMGRKFYSCDNGKSWVEFGTYQSGIPNIFSVYPNPTSDYFNLTSLNEFIKIRQIDIFNIQGNLISTTFVNDNSGHVSIGSNTMGNGLYIIKILKSNYEIENHILTINR